MCIRLRDIPHHGRIRLKTDACISARVCFRFQHSNQRLAIDLQFELQSQLLRRLSAQ